MPRPALTLQGCDSDCFIAWDVYLVGICLPGFIDPELGGPGSPFGKCPKRELVTSPAFQKGRKGSAKFLKVSLLPSLVFEGKVPTICGLVLAHKSLVDPPTK